MSHLNKIRISKNGKLFEETWKKKKQKDIDISNDLYNNLFNVCHIEEGVNLKDILLLVKNWCQVLSPILTSSPNWLQEIVDEGLSKPFEDKGDEVKYLQLSWQGEVRKYKNEPKTLEEWISFNGIGDLPKTDPYGHWKGWPAGKEVSYAISGSPLYTLSEFPIRLNNTIQIFDETDSKAPYPRPILIEAEKTFRLFDILYGIFWELSFLGSPVDRDAFNEKLNEQIKNIDNGTEKTVSWDEIKDKMKKKLEEDK